MIVGDQVAGAIGGLPVAPEGQPQAVPAHAGELRHVLVDHLLAVAVDVAGGAVVGGCVDDVVRAKEAYLPLSVSPPHDSLVVQENGALRENEPQVKHQRTTSVRLAPCSPSALAVSRSRPG